MNFLKRFWAQVLSGGEPDEPLVEMIRAAQVDPAIKQSLLMILRMDTFQRRSAIGSLVARLKIQNAPTALIHSLERLEDDQFAATTLSLLERD